jgi:hypothetical protein
MKNVFYVFALASSLFFSSCGGSTEEQPVASDSTIVDTCAVDTCKVDTCKMDSGKVCTTKK